MKNILTFMGTLIMTTTSIMPMLTINNTNDTSQINQKINYNYHEEYYQGSDDELSMMQIIKWRDYNETWSEFALSHPLTSFNQVSSSWLRASIKNSGQQMVNSILVTTDSILEYKKTSVKIVCPYFETASRYTVIILSLWHDYYNIYFGWNAYFKGNVTNVVEIHLSTVTFGYY